ncbi:tetratricopeptide repeat protein [Ekhidna sp. To15]|uniref:tetratricopeptide repeat protein n=1 Tax=Ekhidna sp. To15 TaxID=3395267 RepID=UPI003F5254E6
MKYVALVFISLIALSCNNEDSLNGDDLFDDGEYQEAIDAYTSYLATHPDHKKSIYNRGRSYEEVGEINKAITDFESLLEIDAKYINAYLSLAKISYNKHDYNKVLIYAGDAIDLNENNAQAHFLAGRAEHQLGYFEQAIESYNNAITINRDFGEAYLYRGAVKVGQEKMRSACEDFKFAKSLDVPGADKAIKDYCE